ncbi:MAG: SRPBCC family protein [Bacteroidales bacterium]|nr:SRPBCC family protein [Bacteroidales bacterium]
MNKTVQSSQIFDNPIEEVWTALSDEKALKKWFFPVRDYKFEVGKEFWFYENEDSSNYLHRCRFTEIIPDKLIAYSWEHPSHSKGKSLVTWEFEQQGNQTRLTLTHTGLETFADAGDDFKPENFQFGWDNFVHDVLRLFLNGIEKLVFKIRIEAKPADIWKHMWDKEMYTKWTEPFCEGSYFEGELSVGKRIHFLSPSGGGMYSNVIYLKENEQIIFQHIGEIVAFKEMLLDENTKKWTGSCEHYQLISSGNDTILRVEVDTDPKYFEFMQMKFPLAMKRLKELIEVEK